MAAALNVGRKQRDPVVEEKLLQRLIAASAWVEQPKQCNRSFAAVVATKKFTGDGTDTILLSDDLISVTTLTENDVEIEEDTDFWVEPANRSPKWELVRNGTWTTTRRGIEVTGIWGYSYETEDTGEVVAEGGLTSSVTTISGLTEGFDIEAGDMLVIGSEQLYVEQVLDATSVAVERACNGTTAAAHLAAVSIRRRVYPVEVQEAVEIEASRVYREASGAFAGNVGGDQATGVDSIAMAYPLVMSRLSGYRKVTVR